MPTRNLKPKARGAGAKSARLKAVRAKTPSQIANTAAKDPVEASEVRHGGSVPLVFARHETFHPRFGWIKKGFDAAQRDQGVFLQDDAQIALGVGKNMVRAIRYWCVAFKVLSESRSTRGVGLSPSPFGTRLLADNGFDPYLEDEGSLWLLHWKLLQRPCSASAWHFAFGLFPGLEFTNETLLASLQEWLSREAPSSRIVRASLRKDVHCIVRMYSESESANRVNEDSIDCPFVELGLIRPLAGQRRSYSFNMGAKPGLSSELIAAACLEFAGHSSTTARSITLSRLLREPMSPGMCFKLTESALYEALEEAVAQEKRLRLSDTAGLLQLSFDEEPGLLSEAFVRRHFKSKASRRISA